MEDLVFELDNKLTDSKRKKSEQKKHLEDMIKAMQSTQKFKPNHMDAVMSSIDEMKEKKTWIKDKLNGVDTKLDQKFKDLDELIKNFDKKMELERVMREANTEIEEYVQDLKQVINVLPTKVKQLKNTLLEMSASAGPGDDFTEKKDEITEQLEELEEIEFVVNKFTENQQGLQDQRDRFNK